MELRDIIEKINRLCEELESLGPISPDNEQKIIQKFRLDWNYNSNNIEGNTLTYGETKAFLLFGRVIAQGEHFRDYEEMKGHNKAINYIQDVIKQKIPLTEAFIRELHKMILVEPYQIDAITIEGKPTTKWVKIGEYKTQPNQVKTVTGEIFRFASPEETPARMQELMNWYRTNVNNNQVHPLILSSEFHYRFITIHPFDDGNGRLVRILMNFILMQKGFPPIIVKTKDKENYYRVLQLADSGNLEPFFIYMGNLLINSFEIKIRGARGEDIEEPEDIDKEIALLKQKLEKVEEPKEKKTRDNTYRIIKSFIDEILFKVIPSLKSIQDFFNERELHITINNWASIPISFDIPSGDLMFLIQGHVKDIAFINQFNISYYLNYFKKTKENPFSDTLNFSLIFGHYNYKISAARCKIEFSKYFHEDLSDDDIKKIIINNKKGCLDYIRVNMKNTS
jgi:Fic family protein